MLVGVDHFARLNESFGNAVGDEVLRAIGARLDNGRDMADSVARIGSDHFAVLFESNATREELAGAAERALKDVAGRSGRKGGCSRHREHRDQPLSGGRRRP
jgi:diguanylate cyclase (GGDEF)-like protein